jgi:hypothetical protein
LKHGTDKGPVIIYGRGEGKIRGGAICINKLLEGGAIKFFQENEGGLQLNLKDLLNKHGIHLVVIVTKSWSLM